MSRVGRSLLVLLLVFALCPLAAEASHISGIRITQTGISELTVDVDVTGFYTTGSTESTMYLGTYYNQVPAIDWGDGSTVPRYGYGPSTGIPLVATSTVVNGIPARAYRGSFTHTYAAPGNYTISANTSCCPQTTPTYTLVSGTILTTTISTSGPFGPTTFTTSFVQNTLDVAVSDTAPTFTVAFADDVVPPGGETTLIFTIDNAKNGVAVSQLAFSNTLPTGLTVAELPERGGDTSASTCGGTVVAPFGGTSIDFSGGTVGAGSTCQVEVAVAVDPTAGGAFDFDPGPLSSSAGTSTNTGGTGGVITLATVFGIDIPTISDLGSAILIGLLALFAFGVIRRQQ